MKEILQPISYPQKGAAGNTGEWRFYKPKINKDRCISCLQCWIFCPEAVIDRETLNIDYQYCKGCGICAYECPKKAIEMEMENSYE